MRRWKVSALVLAVWGLFTASLPTPDVRAIRLGPESAGSQPGRVPAVRVLVIGGSITHGWFDEPRNRGFVERAFQGLADKTGRMYVLYNHAIPGASVQSIARQFPQWLASLHPNLVVMAWGTLNDIHHRLPLPAFQAAIRAQLEEATAAGARVLVVTPPVSRVSFRSYRTLEPRYLNAEMEVARTFPPQQVQVLDLFTQMKAYVERYHVDVEEITHDGWHPNATGHQLAADLLLDDLLTDPRLR
ncbi:MAG: SGNH/GDSL hydrolase family protein [Alicyclobacillus sp.]|nr:SGNH/GDSL hydrolase family protein [Alicyclobacillus sp.]